jgi:hypothetical protein
MKTNHILLIGITCIVIAGCATSPFEDKAGVEAAVNDIALLNSRVSTIRSVARQNNKPGLTNDVALISAYNDAASYVNAYWTNVIGDVRAHVQVNRTADDYLKQPAHKAVTDFSLMASNKLASLTVKESAETIAADNVIKVFDYFYKRVDQQDQAAREDFVKYLEGLSVPDWNAKFEIPDQPSFMTNSPAKSSK